MDFKECGICAGKPGSPYLCSSCLNNRAIIDKAVGLLDGLVDAYYGDLDDVGWESLGRKAHGVLVEWKAYRSHRSRIEPLKYIPEMNNDQMLGDAIEKLNEIIERFNKAGMC